LVITDSRPAILSIHAEPDRPFFGEGNIGNADRWHGFEASVRHVQTLREKVGDAFRVHWLIRLDPQVAEIYGAAEWAFDQYGKAIEELLAAGDHFGLHVHTNRLEYPGRGWILNVDDHNWQSHCISSAHDAFNACFGYEPKSIAIGANIISQPLVDMVTGLGFQYDMTTIARTPEMSFNPHLHADGGQPDFSAIDQLPYRASIEDFRTPGDGPLWILPTSSVPAQPADNQLGGKAGTAEDEQTYERFRMRKGSAGIGSAVRKMEADGVTPFLHFACRSNFFNQMDAAQNLEAIVKSCLERDFRFVPADEAVAHYETVSVPDRIAALAD
jgi:hypothetical protein